MPDRNFDAHLDSTAKAISVVVCVLLAVVAWMVHIIYIAALFPLLICFTLLYAPQGYAIRGGYIVIKRFAGSVQVPLSDIRSLRRGTDDDFRGTVRLWGNGGLFGYFGLFSTSKLGKCSWYVTNRANTVILVTSGKTLVLSPDDPASFVEAAGVSPGAAIRADVLPAPKRANYAGAMVGISIALLALMLGLLAVTYAPGPPAYTLTADSLTIHDRFYPVTLRAGEVDISGVRIVDLGTDSEWRLTARTNGFANQHYQSGWFRTASGKKVRLYRAGGTRLVLIPPKGDGSFVLYQAANPEGFVGDLKGKWGAG